MFGKIKNTIGRFAGATKSAATATAATVAATAKAAGTTIANSTKRAAAAFSSERALGVVEHFRRETGDILRASWAFAARSASAVVPGLAAVGFMAVAFGYVAEGVALVSVPLVLGGWLLVSLTAAFGALYFASTIVLGAQEVIGDLLVATSNSYDFEAVNDVLVIDAVAACPAVAVV